MKKTVRNVALVLWGLIVVVIVVLSLTPGVYSPTQYNMDKVMHFGAYALMAFLPSLVMTSRKHMFMVAVFLMGVGVATEIGQLFVPGRSCTIGDGVADILGVIVGCIVGRYICRVFGGNARF